MVVWASEAALSRLMWHAVAAELQALRPQAAALPQAAPPDDWQWHADGDVDSLERQVLASSLGDFFDLNDEASLTALLGAPTWGETVQSVHAALNGPQAPSALRFRTSGSTGAPRSHGHALETLQAEVQGLHGQLQAWGHRPRRVLSAVKAHHIYGFLWSHLWPALAGLEVLDLQALPPSAVHAHVREGDVVLGYPDWWAAVARRPEPWPEGVLAFSSTAPCPPAVAEAVARLQPALWLHLYGSSDTAGVGWRRWPEPAYTLMPHWQRHGEGLQRVAGGPVVVEPPDELQWHGECHFVPVGRKDPVVQVGGVNVNLAQVEAALRARPGVADVAVRLDASGDLPRLKAFVVPACPGTDTSALQAELEAWGRQQLAPAQRVRHWTFGGQVPVGGMGKRVDWGSGSFSG